MTLSAMIALRKGDGTWESAEIHGYKPNCRFVLCFVSQPTEIFRLLVFLVLPR